jgi:hypothetical protein
MNKIRFVGGSITEYIGGKDTIYAKENIKYNSQKKISFKGEERGIIHKEPKIGPAGIYFKKGWWTDKNDKPIKEALIGDQVKFHIQMDKSKVPPNSEINFTLMEWDGAFNIDDSIVLTSTTKDPKTGKYPELKTLKTDANGKAILYVSLTEGLVSFINDDGGNEIELYFKCSYYDISDNMSETLDLPDESNNYLIVYEKEVLITVIIELPHSSYSITSKSEFLSALGLAGHSAMAIGKRYFDYGPDYSQTIVSEKKYDYDFNDDGDKDDNVDLTETDKNGKPIYTINEKFSPGRPWWGEMIARRKGINASKVTLSDALDFIKLHWDKDGTNIYGEVHKIEFYVKESEAKKMILWWEERYLHLKVYSVYPWTGEQCTTTVKTAIHQVFDPMSSIKNIIPIGTQRPAGLLFDLGFFSSTSKQHFNESAIKTIIKNEATDFKP